MIFISISTEIFQSIQWHAWVTKIVPCSLFVLPSRMHPFRNTSSAYAHHILHFMTCLASCCFLRYFSSLIFPRCFALCLWQPRPTCNPLEPSSFLSYSHLVIPAKFHFWNMLVFHFGPCPILVIPYLAVFQFCKYPFLAAFHLMQLWSFLYTNLNISYMFLG